MHNPLQPRQPPAVQAPQAPVQPVGVTADGQYIYPFPQATPPPQQPALVARPWGMYLGGGCLGVIALSVVAVVIVAIIIGLSIFLMVLAISMVVLLCCLLVMRGMWRQYQNEKE